jgi:hypothetical protein
MKKQVKKLTLSRETFRFLDGERSWVVGGTGACTAGDSCDSIPGTFCQTCGNTTCGGRTC